MALSSRYFWKSVLHVKAPGVLARDKDVGLQEVSSADGLTRKACCCWKGRLISVTSALFLVSVPKPGRVFAAQRIRKTRQKEMHEISLCISPVVVVTILSGKCPSHVLQSLNPLLAVLFPGILKPLRRRVSSTFILPFERDLGGCRAGRIKD